MIGDMPGINQETINCIKYKRLFRNEDDCFSR